MRSHAGSVSLAATQSVVAEISTAALRSNRSTKRVLEPAERIAEVLFGLIMVLTFTGSLSVAEAGRADVRSMVVGALGCNLAWAVIDGLFYLMGCLAEKGRNLATHKAVLGAKTPEHARRLIAGALPAVVAQLLTVDELDRLRERALRLPAPPKVVRLDRRSWLGGWAVFVLVFLSTFPVALPFMLVENAVLAMRLSNSVALAMLFLAGYAYGRVIHRSPVAIGAVAVFVGLVIVTFTIALGG
jgi:VIT1/CCC1 family predicted Fe2+/Mn2+ transporter